MASYNYKLNRDEAITEALSLVGIGEAGEPVHADDIAEAARKLNIMLKAWQSYGIKLWKRQTKSITLTAGKYSYTIGQKSAGTATSTSAGNLVDSTANFTTDEIAVGDTVLNTTDSTTTTVSGLTSTTTNALTDDIFTSGEAYEITDADVSLPRPLSIVECSRKDSSNNEVTMNPLSKQEYEDLPNKTTQSTPINFHYDPTLNNGTFYIWPAPDTTAASEYTVDIVAHIPTSDMDNSTDDIDFPNEWLEAITYGLAYRLAPSKGLNRGEREALRIDMQMALDLAKGGDEEFLSVRFAPEMR